MRMAPITRPWLMIAAIAICLPQAQGFLGPLVARRIVPHLNSPAATTTTTTLPILRHISSTIASYQQQSPESDDDNHDDNDRIATDVPVAAAVVTRPPLQLSGLERTWRHAKKPLLSIGAKGATLSHGNSLRQLLEAHTAVKIKVNTKHFDNSLTVAYEALKNLVMEAGAAAEPELLHVRESERVILVGAPGSRRLIEANEFPPPPPPPRPEDEESVKPKGDWKKEPKEQTLAP